MFGTANKMSIKPSDTAVDLQRELIRHDALPIGDELHRRCYGLGYRGCKTNRSMYPVVFFTHKGLWVGEYINHNNNRQAPVLHIGTWPPSSR